MTQKSKERHGEIRCLNCFERFYIGQGTKKTACPKCGMEWRISWPYLDTAKIRGPVWEKITGAR